mmetsp:Transcript_48372/g.56552  ORF Transcript_48372/g.56552 Transcript_48372/m.56552 type:complete len:110 (+) Transcript_48372:253-582(+)
MGTGNIVIRHNTLSEKEEDRKVMDIGKIRNKTVANSREHTKSLNKLLILRIWIRKMNMESRRNSSNCQSNILQTRDALIKYLRYNITVYISRQADKELCQIDFELPSSL